MNGEEHVNWFGAGGADYAAGRPDYPAELAGVLTSLAPSRRLAVDVGGGTGQLTRRLAGRFDRVVGLDPSVDQIANCEPVDGVEYRVASAEATGLPDGVADVVTVAQAAHWFDLPAFYDEVVRIAAADAVLALVTYGVVVLDDDLAARFDRFYRDEIGPFWPPERRHVDNGYADLDFPFPRLEVEVPDIERDWTLDELLGYVQTWSAVRSLAASNAAASNAAASNASGAGESDVVEALAGDLRSLWGGADRRRTVRWPVTVVAGRVNPRR